MLRTGNTEFDAANARVSCASRPLDLRLGERRQLALLRRRCGHVVPAQALEQAFSDLSRELSPNASGIVIATMRGVGYVLKPASGAALQSGA